VQVEWGGEQLQLLPERALHHRRAATLFIADPHFGKAASFRQLGVPVPAGTTSSDLNRLEAVLARTGARRLIVLGDFLHARMAETLRTLAVMSDWWTRQTGLETIVVRGNHDCRAGDPPAHWGIRIASEPFDDGTFVCCHEPRQVAGRFVLAGHYHPAVMLEGPNRSSLRLPCFRLGPRTAILPAFGRFTGAKAFRPRPGERIFVVGPDEVAEAKVRP
jgi:DNA ligase-associated metallophosphoesterase